MVPERFGNTPVMTPDAPGGVRPLGSAGLLAEVREADQPLVHALDGPEEEIVRQPPDGEASLPDRSPQERGEVSVRDDRLPARMPVAGDLVDRLFRRRLPGRSEAHLGPCLPAEEQGAGEHRGETERRAPKQGDCPGGRRQCENEDERHRIPRHRPVVEEPQGQEGRNEDEEEVDRTSWEAAGRDGEPQDCEPDDDDRVADGEEVPHGERVEDRPDRPRLEGARPEPRPLSDAGEEPGNAPGLAEEPQPPRERPRQTRRHERRHRDPASSIPRKADRFHEEQRPEREDEMRANAGSRSRRKSRDEGG